MKWQQKRTASGWHWWRAGPGAPAALVWAAGGMFFTASDSMPLREAPDYGEWAGPLTPPGAGAERITRADVENAAASLFITDGGREADLLVICTADGTPSAIDEPRRLIDVVDLLCHHLEIPSSDSLPGKDAAESEA